LPGVETLAATYLQLIREVQPEGPYQLGGYCNGGMVAYEMARQLQADGQQIDLLLLLDPPSLSVRTHRIAQFASVLGRLIYGKHPGSIKHKWALFLRLKHFIKRGALYLYPKQRRLDEFEEIFLRKDPAFNRLFPPLETLQKETFAFYIWLYIHYSWQPYQGKVNIIWAEEEECLRADAEGNLKQLTREEFTVPGSHHTMVTEYVDTLAERVRKIVRREM
jgi:thioesterase domain-containing protein